MPYRLARPLLFRLPAETAHTLTLRALSVAALAGRPAPEPALVQRVAGIAFPNPVGIAPGFDKNAQVADSLFGLGFGFVEIGTVTPRPQEGNPRPRLFRLVEDEAIINRMGFNNDGHAAVKARLARRDPRTVLGVNIGANKDATDRVADYVAGVRLFAEDAAYLVANISSPNTPGLRDLQAGAALRALVAAVTAARDAAVARIGRPLPVLVKVAPDLDAAAIAEIAATIRDSAVDGLVVSNTTTARPALAAAGATETGGLSGAPLFHRATAVLARFRLALGPEFPIVGVGGVTDGATAFAKIAAGATLLQLYTAFVLDGPAVIPRVLAGLGAELERGGFPNLAAARGSQAERWAREPIV